MISHYQYCFDTYGGSCLADLRMIRDVLPASLAHDFKATDKSRTKSHRNSVYMDLFLVRVVSTDKGICMEVLT